MTGIRVARLAPRAPSEREKEGRGERASERERESARLARRAHLTARQPLPRATAAHFKSVALRPSSWKYLVRRRSFLAQSAHVAAYRAIVVPDPPAFWARSDLRGDERPVGDTPRVSVATPRARVVFFYSSGQCRGTPLREFHADGGDARVARPGIHRSWTTARRLPPEISCLKDRPVSTRMRTNTHTHTGGTARRSECHSRRRSSSCPGEKRSRRERRVVFELFT